MLVTDTTFLALAKATPIHKYYNCENCLVCY